MVTGLFWREGTLVVKVTFGSAAYGLEMSVINSPLSPSLVLMSTRGHLSFVGLTAYAIWEPFLRSRTEELDAQ